MTKGDITLENMNCHHLGALLDKLTETGILITERNGHMRIKVRGKLKSVSATTHAYPGFPTDLQAQMTALMCVTPGLSIITEKIYPERFMHISELNRMGANIRLEGPSAIVSGARTLSGAPVMASDLRASAALVIAGIAAHGRSEVSRMYHLDRGYENLVQKFQALGADITRDKDIAARITPAQV
jgi:UDP-N-acetylglucosamine 1-carboxyvinyltransferase